MSRKNFFLLLEMDFNNIPEDENEIKNKIKRKRAEWSKLRNHPGRSTEAKANLELVSAIEAVMLDPDQRLEEAEAAREMKKREALEKEREAFSAVDKIVRVLSARGWVYESEVADLVKIFHLSESQVKSRISLPVKAASSKQNQRREITVDTSKAKKIAELCENIGVNSAHPGGVPSLYDFLQVSPTSSLDTLLETADEKYKELSKKRRDAKSEYETKLQSYCKSIFQRERKEYDLALIQLRLESLKETIQIATSSSTLDDVVFEQIVKEGMSLGVTQEEVTSFITGYCAQNHITVGSNNNTKKQKKLKQCGHCGLVNGEHDKYCSRCANELEVTCPSCKSIVPSTAHVCGSCGFEVGDLYKWNQIIREANYHLSVDEVEIAERLYHLVLSRWPDNVEVKKKLMEVQRKQKEQENKIATIMSFVENKRFYAARSELLRMKRTIEQSVTLKSIEEVCRDHILSAESLLKRARNLQDENQAAQYYMKAMEIAADCKEANDMIAKWPPESPKSLQITPRAAEIHLKWQPSESPGTIHYRVLRKKGSEILHSTDGEIIQENMQSSFVDNHAEGGTAYFYGVFAVRGQTVSEKGMVQGPFVRRPEVEDVTIHQDNSVIELNWIPPKGATSVEVWRKEGAVPTKRQDGTKLKGVTLDGVKDDTVTFGKTYGFRIVVRYGTEEAPTFSEGVSLQSKAIRLPKVVSDFTIKREDNGVFVKIPEMNDEVHIYYANQAFTYKKGETCPIDKLPQLGDKVILSEKKTAFVKMNLRKPLYFIPVSFNEEVAVFGEMKVSKDHPEVSNIFHKVEQNSLIVQWIWPDKIKRVIVAYRKDAFPVSHDDPQATKIQIEKGSYELLDGYKISSREQDYYFTIFTVYEEGDDLIYSNGEQYLCLNTKPVEISYEINTSSFFKKKVRISLSTDTAVTLPGLVLVKKALSPPTSKTDGKEIYRIPGNEEMYRTKQIDIPSEHFEKNMYARLFFINDKEAPKVRLQPKGGKEVLRLW
ncbi:double zinc ribbon domain-containing protein [Alkalihalobacterium chitinilyticum]|uniref:Zinc ribbon domain-containing protein n=1 Tax=Alkalihalobacterium chitinilyticum TaxID=2980103 RepID=A0ABT5VHW6_9BACI|nr:zinc ribbon domain-containing protein [Alkalihalobacterium chitinilyticum]MDE5414058.1 zinc ribbon domain-containing protein [Alkalihalobacterium chitinilyticum]